MDASFLMWGAFNIFILLMLAIDLLVFHRNGHVIRYKEAVIWSCVWVALALIFCIGLYWTQGYLQALNFLTGYLIEKALSVDNLFVFLLIFSYFSVPEPCLHKVLFWGVLGALVMRAIFIFAGILLIQKFYWITYVLGAFLIMSGFKLAFGKEQQVHPENNLTLQFLKKFIPMTSDYVGQNFFIKQNGKYFATPLFAALVAIETTDIVFAIDSVPAILAITTDPFIVYTSNVFAVLGLRAFYFALAGFMKAFEYLYYGLALLLIFIGIKMLLSDYVHIPIAIALAIVGGILGISVIASLVAVRLKKD